jgi:membrane protease YdiL (CAAX protease family)
MFGGQQNPLITAAKTAKRLPLSYFAPAVIWVIFIIGILFQGIANLVVPIMVDSVIGDALTQTIFLIIAFGTILLMLWLWVKFYEQRPFATLGFFRTGNIGAKIGLGALVGFLTIATAFGAAILLGAFTVVNTESPNFGVVALPAVLIALIGWVVQGSTEEIAFRGWLLPVMGAKRSLQISVAVSSIVFAALHMFNPGVTVLGVVNLALFGLFAAVYALHEGGIWGICALHAVWNWTGRNIFGTTISGSEASFGLLSLAPTDASTLLTGGTFGIEGSVITTIMLVIGIAAVWFLERRKPMNIETQKRKGRKERA